ncbi:HAMP domain-containing methyl-accepting chemotaxis protein [Paludibaculum fermentans]|uniref:MCP four helix bundle domain-containing protein n=1 Tax=Paludibaculum fermentans TaxID=1473598 RepID=A0A7S7SKS7_PALFE|nr:methyl-accepting chemotaxis protein [Paludibaculum fermentans]QOY88659.1 MCP four helix bundle domain-containing protein [Paludibaculum fermentans]
MNGNISFGTKINIASGAIVAFLLLLGASAIYTLSDVQGQLERSVNVEARKSELAMQSQTAVTMIEGAQRGLLLGSMTNDAPLVQASSLQMKDSVEKLASALKELEPLLKTDEGKRHQASLSAMSEEVIQKLQQFESSIRGQRFDEATRMQTEYFRGHFDKMRQRVVALVDLQHQFAISSSASAISKASFARMLAVVVCLLALGVAGMAFWVIRNGNRELRQIAVEIGEGADQVASASNQISGSSQSLAQGSSEQAASLQETSASTEEVNAMTRKNAESARSAATETEKADQLLKETDQKLTQMIESMREINTSSEKISKIIRVIDEIAFQTNILALNAAVEAARAGEAGMGFAVVADEVRNLAQRCAQAAKDTSDLIEESIVRSNEGKVRLDEVSSCVSRVVDNASRIRVLANEVNVGSQEQARGIEQITRAVGQMQQVTQSTAASAEESASAGEQMSAQALSLNDSVGRLRLLVGSEGGAVAVRPAVRQGRSLQAGSVKRARQNAGAVHVAVATGVHKAPAAKVPARPPAKAEFPMDDDFKDF